MNLQRQTYFSVSSVGVPIRNTADYSPFGVQLDGRTIQGDFYRRGFNGMEKDDEVKGGGNSYTTEFRQYEARVGRWLSLDPLLRKTMESYHAFSNNPLRYNDVNGKESNDIIIRGTDGKKCRIKAKGDDITYDVPFSLKKNNTIDIGIKNVDPKRFAIGYTMQADATFAAAVGGGPGLEVSVVQFTDTKYKLYNYVYAGFHENITAGAQASISASAAVSVFIAYNTSKSEVKPQSFEGVSIYSGVTADIKVIAGGGLSISKFSPPLNKKGWNGVSIGFNVGVGESVNFGSFCTTISKTWLINDVVPTSQRGYIDRTYNAFNPISSAIVTGSFSKINNLIKK